MLARGFEEGRIANIDEGFPADRHAYTEEYDYDSDSDLDEETPSDIEKSFDDFSITSVDHNKRDDFFDKV